MIFNRHEAPPPATTLYQLQQRVVAIGGDYWIDNGIGQHAYRVDGKALRLRQTFLLKDPSGAELLRLRRKLMRLRETMLVDRDGETVATVHKHLVGLRDRFTVDLAGGGELHTKGDFLAHEYTVTRDGAVVADISKRWLRVRDTYGISIVEGEDVPLLLAVAVCVDVLCHGG
ncbi:hypothetical protein HII36_33445 [Nonomuraea sp. NN258]|uniref:LURP-one-related/scramblase family protein n=1 Tax=Nonomuraea antri TaxID=2730852 RepID=UPI0015697CFA|nr:LURP-one-related family protein [Nonomuraea antri]NRQ36705.1 hypothetical protein [Nonomuraea antri]